MRLLIYLLALMSGFSAADAAREGVSPTSSVAQTAVAVADVLVAQEQESVVRPASVWPRILSFAPLYFAAPTFITLTPITRRDVTQQ